MRECPRCGYVRRPLDDEFTNAPANACPRCFTPYEKDPSDEAAHPAAMSPPLQPSSSEGMNKKSSSRRTYLLMAVTAVIAVLATLTLTSRHNKPDTGTGNIAGATWNMMGRESGEGTTETGNAPQSISEIARRIGPSVVAIIAYNQNREPIGRASGFFIDDSGHVITNYHALQGSASSEIRTAAGRNYPISTVMAEDRGNDLVMVSTGAPREEIRPLRLSSSLPQVGEKIVVIGNPLGLEQTVSDGIVSAFRQHNNGRRMIQITAPISPGSSGSPVVNMRGEIIGVAFMQIVGGQNLNFCIPAENVSSLGAHPGYATADFTAQPSSDRLYCYIDENKRIRFIKNPPNTDFRHVLLTRDDGTPDRDRFERWIFDQMGRNPYKINPQAEVEAERERLPEHFQKIFPGYEMEQLGRFAPEARAYWGSWVANHMQRTYEQASRARQEGIQQHKQLMEIFDQYARH